LVFIGSGESEISGVHWLARLRRLRLLLLVGGRCSGVALRLWRSVMEVAAKDSRSVIYCSGAGIMRTKQG
jgi:hypothetical protein